MTEKENILKVYRHEKPDHLPDPSAGIYTHNPLLGILERPDDGGDTDWFGVKYLYEPSIGASVPNPLLPYTIQDVTLWREEVKIPDIENYDWEKAAKTDRIDDKIRETKLYSLLIQAGIYERFHSLLGMEEAYIALMEEPEESKALIDAIADYKYKLFAKLIEYYKPDIIRCHDDYGSQTAMQLRPSLWREIIKPHMSRFAQLCHENGVLYEQHSCGLVAPVIGDFAEVGVDSWQGMHINDVPALMDQTDGKLAYHMSLDIQRYEGLDMVGKLTEARLREDVRDTITEAAKRDLYFPTGSSPNRGWWGNAIIADEIIKCRETITY
jgi:uroporphyrinogen decarboxylase